VSTSGLDQAASDAQASYSQSMGELAQLEEIARKKASDDAAKNATAPQKNAAIQPSNAMVSSVDSLAKSAEAMNAKAGQMSQAAAVATESGVGSFGGSGTATLNSASGSRPFSAGASLNAVDVTKVDISFDGASTSVYTEPGKSSDLISILQSVRDRA